jgi:glycine cleavage system H protein
MNGETITYMGTLWLQIENNTVTIGVNEDGLETITSITKVDLPQEGESVEGDEICGELETDDGPFNIFAPVSGQVVEINGAVLENPSLIVDDCYAEGWLLKIEAENADELTHLVTGASYEH